jgi:FkbM family methyltransferase
MTACVRGHFPRYAIKSFSQEGEDLVLFRLFGDRQSGFFVDVGAHHPIRFSNTYLFYRKGWRGVNIDAMPGSMRLFNRLRRRDINIEAAVSDAQNSLTYYMFNEPALNGFSSRMSEERNGLKGYSIIGTKKITTRRLDSILASITPSIPLIDFLSIDVEGLDMNVLQSNDWNRFVPSVICIEVLGKSMRDICDSPTTSFLAQRGYEPFAKTINTVIFCHI